MSNREPKSLPVAVRVYPKPDKIERENRWQKSGCCPEGMLVFDTEARMDAAQRLTFGSYRFIVAGQCLEEGLFYGDDLPDRDRQVLEDYVTTHGAETDGDSRPLLLLSRNEFLKKLYQTVYKSRCLLVGFNLPFDLSRIAHDSKNARGPFAGGFSLGIWSYVDHSGRERPNRYRPRIRVKQINNKRALIGFTARKNPDKTDLIPENSPTGKPKKGYKFRGHFLDLRTLAFALTDRGYSLEAACEAFDVEHGKHRAVRHGAVTEEYIDYNRRDVLATSELAAKLLEEHDKHPIDLQATKAYSPASIGKAYLRAMGIKPILERQPDFPPEYLGYAESAFFGGRTSVHIRKLVIPVVYTDFLSMYTTVNGLMGLWRYVIARKIEVVEHCEAEIEPFLRGLTLDDLFKPTTWKRMAGFVQIIPEGDILPARSKYSVSSNDWQVGINHLYAGNDNALWYSIPDVVASVLLSGRIPQIIDAFRIEPHGTLMGLKPTKLRGAIEIDPRSQDFFKVVVEERQRLSSRTELSDKERGRLDKALKILASAASYGIYAEMNRNEPQRKIRVTCHGIDPEPFTCRIAHPELPGEYCFPPFASLITGAARLMLALLEHCVCQMGGTYVMEDTDSMAIVATERGGMFTCPGGLFGTSKGNSAVKALSREQVEQISARFAALSPYGRDAVPGSILKIEEDNFDPTSGRPRQLYCFAISAKRYALFLRDENDDPVLLRKGLNNKENRWSEHGLGHLGNPIDPESEDRDWIPQAWLDIVRKAMGLPTQSVWFEQSPAMGRVTISSPAVLRPFANLNDGKPYADQIKPFNFLSSCHVKQFGHPAGVDPERFHLVAPYESDPRRWLEQDWIDQYTGQHYRITTEGHFGTHQTVRVKTYGDILTEYEFHPGSKCADATGRPSGKQTIGLLQRRHIRVQQIKYIGKESNSFEEVGSSMIHSAQSVYTEYPDPRRDEWRTRILPALKHLPLRFLEMKSGKSRRMLIDALGGRSRPHPKNQALLAGIVRDFGLI